MGSPPDHAHGPHGSREREGELRAWMERYGPALKRYFQRKVSPAEADELVQDVFLAMHARGRAEAIDNVQGYLFRVAANLIAKRAGPGIVTTSLEDALELSEGLSSERIVIARQEASRVLAAIRDLPPRTREAFVLHCFEDMSYGAIAQRLGISVSAVSKLVARALAHVARELRREP